MMKFRVVAVAALLAVFSVSTSHAIVGVGVHYGLDFSMSMKDVGKDGLKIGGDGFNMELPAFGLPDGIGKLNVADADFLYVSRSDFKSSYIHLGGKVFVDIIPYINTLELSGNFGIWQYEGAVHYLDVKKVGEAMGSGSVPNLNKDYYQTRKLTLSEVGKPFFGLSGTPYAKLQLDASVRKDVFKIPLDIFKVNAGGGFTVDFTTPILGSYLVNGVRNDEKLSPEEMVAKLSDKNSDIGRQIVLKILDELFTPRYGMHIVAGAHVKIPAVPIGFYADGKLMIPFSKFDENGDVSGLGVLFNVGAALQF